MTSGFFRALGTSSTQSWKLPTCRLYLLRSLLSVIFIHFKALTQFFLPCWEILCADECRKLKGVHWHCLSIRIRVRVKYDKLRTCIRIDLGNWEGKRTASDASRFRDVALFLKETVYFLVEDIKKQTPEGYWKKVDVLNVPSLCVLSPPAGTMIMTNQESVSCIV